MSEMQLEGEIASPAKPPPGCYFHPRCPYVIDICRVDMPALEEVEPGRFARCHRARELNLPGLGEQQVLPAAAIPVQASS